MRLEAHPPESLPSTPLPENPAVPDIPVAGLLAFHTWAIEGPATPVTLVADLQSTAVISKKRMLSTYDFREEGYIGSGGWGFVHLSRHLDTGTQVAIKSIQKTKVAGKEDHVLREQATLRAVSGQEGVLDLLASFHDDAFFYLATVSD